MQAKILGGVAAELDGADTAAVEALLMVEPRSQHQKQIRMIGVLRFECFVERNVAVNVLLVPQTVDQHHGDRDSLPSQDLIERLVLPKRIVRRMHHDLVGEADLIETVQPRHVAGGPAASQVS